jgi:hypothetical protein
MAVWAALIAAAAGVWAAGIAALASILVALVSAVIALRAQNQANLLETFRTDATRDLEELKARLQETAEEKRRKRDAEVVLARYREPLTAAAYDLQSRLHNILEDRFLETYATSENERQEEAIASTLFRFAQYFAWAEILRQDIHSWRFTKDADTRAVGAQLAEVQEAFLSDLDNPDFMVWRDEQRAIGELMIVQEGDTKTCLGYARFVQLYGGDLAHWLGRLDRSLRKGAGPKDERLSSVQLGLLALVKMLDPQQLRYDHSTMKAAFVF